MNKIATVPYPTSLHRYTKARQFSIAASRNSLYVQRVYEQDILEIDLKTFTSKTFARLQSAPPSLTELKANDNILQTHCIAYANETIFSFVPGGQSVRLFSIDGEAKPEIPVSFQILGITHARNSLFALGFHDQRLLHELGSGGEIKRSCLPVTDSFSARNLTAMLYSTDKRVVYHKSGAVSILSEQSAGIIDAVDENSGEILRRVALVANNPVPIDQVALGGEDPAETSLMLIWPPRQAGVSGISIYESESILMLSGSGRYAMVLDKNFKPETYFRLPEFGPRVSKNVVAAQQVPDGRWVVGLMDGEIWLVKPSEISLASRDECLNDFSSVPFWQRRIESATSPHLLARDVERHSAFWRSLEDCSLSFVASLRADGSVVEIRRGVGSQDSSDSSMDEKLRIALKSMRFSPRIIDGQAVSTNLRIFVDVNGWAKYLMNTMPSAKSLLA